MVQYKDAIKVIKKYEIILKTQQQNMISIAYTQGRIIKWFKGTKRFSCMSKELGMSNSTITMCFKIIMYKKPRIENSTL